MSTVLFTISYSIKPEKREDYLALVKEMCQHLVEQKQKKYNVYEQKGKKNSFMEIFTCGSIQEFDALEEDQDETMESFVHRLEEYLEEGKMRYTTLVEIE